MADIVLTIDPDDTAFALHDRANGRRLMGFEAPVPATDSQWAYSADTEGERRANLRYQNRVITADVMLDKSTAALLEALENTLGQKIGKLAREGGELRFTYPTGTAVTFNVLEASMQRSFDIADMAKFRARYEIEFICEPFGLGAEEDLGDNTETTLPALIFTEATVDGDMSALGRLVIDEDDAEDQWWVVWGIQSRYYSSSANAALFYEAEGRTPLGSAATSTTPSGGSGAGSNVVKNTDLLTTYQGILSTQATGGGAHLSHVGTFRVYARVQADMSGTGTVTVALEWAEGDFLKYTRNPEVAIPYTQADTWRLVDLGLVSLKTATAGTQRWEGRIIAKASTAGDDLAVDYFLFVPVDEGSGIVQGVAREYTPTTFSVSDDFTSTTSGNALNARTPPTGAAWATSGAATDFAFIDAAAATYNTTEAVSRSVSGSGERIGLVGSNMTTMQVQSAIGWETLPLASSSGSQGIIARGIDDANHVRLAVSINGLSGIVTASMVWEAAGVSHVLDSATFTRPSVAFFLLTLTVTAGGRAIGVVQDYNGDTPGQTFATLTGSNSAMATGGTLASGKPGIYDAGNGSDVAERFWDGIRVIVPPIDAAMFASQSLEIRHDRARREDSGGTLWVAPSSYMGDYLLVPPSGAEGRTTRVVIKASRADPFNEEDPGIDDISARLFVTPRYLVVPQA